VRVTPLEVLAALVFVITRRRRRRLRDLRQLADELERRWRR
jgi:HAMP domain-containing protein